MDSSRQSATHEDFSREAELKSSSDRAFGLVVAAFFLVLAMRPYISGRSPRIWAIAVGVAFLALAITRPRLLAPLNRVWLRLGLLIQKVMNPVVMGILFFSTVTPIGFLMRLLGKDPLRLRWEPDANSYWIVRKPAGTAPESMKHQF
jgi:saxitoxin biosynthesis operon SxtJ-like protein